MTVTPRLLRFLSATICVAIAASLPLAAQTYTASPIASSDYATYPYDFTGLITTASSTGSGAVVQNPRVVYSCAHVVFNSSLVDPWQGNVHWNRAWSTGLTVFTTDGQLMRSYYYFTGYATAALVNKASPQSFSQDFVVYYAFENTANGGFAGWWPDGVGALKSTRTKLITGYPNGLYVAGDTRKYLQHRTGPFTRAYADGLGDYLTITEVSTGPGNSGGPVWVSDGTQYYYAGVVVSGLERSLGDSTDLMGLYAVDSSSTTLIDAAIAAGGATVTAPVITSQPTSRRVNVGDTATFTVTATGSSLSYRWLFNGSVISSATGATLTMTNTALSKAGNYQVIVSNTGGETPSTVVTLTVDPLTPTITTQPTTLSASIGSSATFSVAVQSGTNVTYQWRKDGVAISGATSATLTLSNVQTANAGSYTVTVTNSFGSVTSSAATLTVTAASRLSPSRAGQESASAATF